MMARLFSIETLSDAEDMDGAFPDPEDNPVIADPELPISRQGFSKLGPVI